VKVGSLFDGIGGFLLAAERFGMEPVWASEIEPFPICVTKKRFSNVKHLGDVTKIHGDKIEPVDLVTFGSPCQDMSVAGQRKGMAKTCQDCGYEEQAKVRTSEVVRCPVCGSEHMESSRSGLFMEAIRIIREMRNATNGKYPRFALWENVPGALSSNKGADFRAVLEEITTCKISIPKSGKWGGAGMVRSDRVEVAWRVLDAQYFGVPQRRKRIFLVTDFGGRCAGEVLFVEEGL